MISFSATSSEAALARPSTPLPRSPFVRPPNRWSYGRSYAVIALLAPVLLASLLILHLHNAAKAWLSLWRLQLQR